MNEKRSALFSTSSITLPISGMPAPGRLPLLAIVLACLVTRSNGYVVGGAVMHHGALALDPRNFNGSSDNATEAATALHYAALHAGSFIQSLEPEILLLITPHGLALPQPYVLYNDPTAEGSVSVDAWLPCSFPPCVYNASAQLDVHLTRQLEAALSGHGLNVMSLSGFGPPGEGTLPLPLAWAEVIPLYFIGRAYAQLASEAAATSAAHQQQQWRQQQQHPLLAEYYRRRAQRRRLAAATAVADRASGGRIAGGSKRVAGDGGGGGSLPHVVILSVPTRRYDHSVSMVPELLALGAALFSQLDSLDARIAVVVSGDLAHTWDSAGPYGFSEHAARFDAAVVQWARDLDRGALLKTAAKNECEAKSCGFPGLVLLQGLMDGVKPDNMHSVLLEYGHPSYYGMMCAVFDFQGDA